MSASVVFVATPMYGGNAKGPYIGNCLGLLMLSVQQNISIDFRYIFSEALVTRARNYLVDEFLQSDATHLMFIDADIGFRPEDVLALLATDLDVVGGCYPKKTINWQSVHSLARRQNFSNPEELAQFTGDHLFTPLSPPSTFDEPVEVSEIGTGFLMIKRQVFERFKQAYPKLSFLADHRELGRSPRRMHLYFDCFIENDRYLSEDYGFCHRWRRIGGRIYGCPWMPLQHVGDYVYQGNIPGVTTKLGSDAAARETRITKVA